MLKARGGRGAGIISLSRAGSGGKKETQQATPSRLSTRFADNTAICVTRSTEKLHIPADGDCPQGLVKCQNTSVTMCHTPGDDSTCPVTDVKIVLKADYSASAYPGYTIAEAPNGLNWLMLFSRTSGDLPVTRFELTEEKPCSLSDTYKVTGDIYEENYNYVT